MHVRPKNIFLPWSLYSVQTISNDMFVQTLYYIIYGEGVPLYSILSVLMEHVYMPHFRLCSVWKKMKEWKGKREREKEKKKTDENWFLFDI